jgi:hypothetical protein
MSLRDTGDRHKHGQSLNSPWWAFLTRYLQIRDEAEPSETVSEIDDPQVTDTPEVQAHCRHMWIRKTITALSGRMFARSICRSTIKGLCPICGLLPKGDRKVEHVLKIWFVDGEMCEYRFRNRAWNECHRISDNALHILMDDSVLTYSMELVSSVTFGTREITPDPPEVVAAEHIIASRHPRN